MRKVSIDYSSFCLINTASLRFYAWVILLVIPTADEVLRNLGTFSLNIEHLFS